MNSEENSPLFSEPSEAVEPAPRAHESLPKSDFPPSGGALLGQPHSKPPVPQDLRVPWSWRDLLLFVGVFVAMAVVVAFLLDLGFAVFGVSSARLRSSPGEQSFFALIMQLFLFVLILAYLVVQIRMRVTEPFWRTIGWRRLAIGRMSRAGAYVSVLAIGVAFAIVIELLSSIIGTNTKLPIETFYEYRRTAILLMIMAVALAPVIEETVFRGFIYPVVARTFGVPAGVIGTGVLFGLLHAPQLWGGWGQIGLLIVVGIAFTYARAVTRTVVASYLLHVSYNSLICVFFLIATHGLHRLPPAP